MRTLILAPSSLRDAVMSQPFLAALSRLRLHEHIDVVADADIAPVYECMAGIGRVWATDSLQSRRNTLGLMALARQLRRTGYRRAYILGDQPRAALLAWLAGAPVRIGTHRRARWGLITEIRAQPGAGMQTGDRARIEHFVRLAFDGPALMHASLPAPELKRCPEREAAVRGRTGLPAQVNFLLVLCFDDHGHAARRWPVRHWAALISKVRQRWPEAVVTALGNASVRATATEAFALSGVTGRNLCGQLSQSDAISIVAQAHSIVGLDNALMHVGGAFARPLVSLFGPSDPLGHAPLHAQTPRHSPRLECIPCNDPVCRHGHGRCMSGLTPDAALEALQAALGRTLRNIR